MTVSIDQIENKFLGEISEAATVEALEKIKSAYLGKKGALSELYQEMARLSHEEKPKLGSQLNRLRALIQDKIDYKRDQILESQFIAQSKHELPDLTLPEPKVAYQGRHPITQTMEFLIDILTQMGFDVGDGPEIEDEDFNFTYLNIPDHHPARAEHDTFYIKRPWLLRTHTSPVQIHYMRKYTQTPIHMIAPGRVYRADDDATHSPMFHQIEGLGIDRGIHFGHLKGIIRSFLKQVFEMDQVRFRPSYFPFTEPSTEIDIGCVFCKGKGCRVCKQSGWLEVMGAGLVHPEVIRYGGYTEKNLSGYAFGMGIERITMLLFKIPDMRMLFDNDPRILGQVGRIRKFPMMQVAP